MHADVVGEWGSTDASAPHVILTADGRLHGSDGCNRMLGQWQLAGGKVVFGPIATTRRFCQGVDTSLSRMRTARPSAQGLQFFDAEDHLLATLSRSR